MTCNLRLANATVRLFELFSSGELKLFEDPEIEEIMKFDLSWNNARIIWESDFQEKYKDEPSRYTEVKTKHMTQGKFKKILSSKWKKI